METINQLASAYASAAVDKMSTIYLEVDTKSAQQELEELLKTAYWEGYSKGAAETVSPRTTTRMPENFETMDFPDSPPTDPVAGSLRDLALEIRSAIDQSQRVEAMVCKRMADLEDRISKLERS